MAAENLSPYDKLEFLRFSSAELLGLLDALGDSMPQAAAALSAKFQTLSDRWFALCEQCTEDLADSTGAYESQQAHEQLHSQLRPHTISAKQQDFQTSIHKVKALCAQNVQDLECSLQRHQKAQRASERAQRAQLQSLDLELSTALASPPAAQRPAESSSVQFEYEEESLVAIDCGPQFSVHEAENSVTNYDEELSRLLAEQCRPQDQVNDSKISLEKTQGK